MTNNLAAVILCSAALLGGLAFSQSPSAQGAQGAQDPPEKRIARLEADLAAMRARVDAAVADAADARARCATVAKYLDRQAKVAAEMARTLDESETAGFTYGINPDSRHILLAGWRKQLAAAQKDVPAAPAEAAATPQKTGAQR